MVSESSLQSCFSCHRDEEGQFARVSLSGLPCQEHRVGKDSCVIDVGVTACMAQGGHGNPFRPFHLSDIFARIRLSALGICCDSTARLKRHRSPASGSELMPWFSLGNMAYARLRHSNPCHPGILNYLQGWVRMFHTCSWPNGIFLAPGGTGSWGRVFSTVRISSPTATRIAAVGDPLAIAARRSVQHATTSLYDVFFQTMGLVAVSGYNSMSLAPSLLVHQSNPLQIPFATPASTLHRPQYSTIIVPTTANHSLIYTSSMSINTWADTARRNQWRQSPEQQRAIDTLKVVFEGQEDPTRAASAIASIYDPLLKRGFEFSPVNQLWTMICEATQMLGGDREIDERLISLLNAISKLPDVTDKDGHSINGGPYGNYKVYWRELPSLAILFREYAIGPCPPTTMRAQLAYKKQTSSPEHPKCPTKATGPTLSGRLY